MSNKIISGDNLMVFAKDNNEYKSIGYATEHSLSVSVDVKRVSSHNIGIFSSIEPTYASWSISCEHLYTEETYSWMMDALKDRKVFTLLFGLPSNFDENGLGTEEYWTSTTGYRGKAILTSLRAFSETGDIATFSASFVGVSSLSKIDDIPHHAPQVPERDDVLLFFANDSVVMSYSPTSMYKLPKLTNNAGLPVRYYVGPTASGRVIEDGEDSYLVTEDTGAMTVYAIFDGDDDFIATSANVSIQIGEDDSEDDWHTQPVEREEDDYNTKIDAILRFERENVYIEQNDYDLYDIEDLFNPYNVPVTLTCINAIATIDQSNWQISATSIGDYRIVATFAGNETYNPVSAGYNLYITERNVTPDKESVTWNIDTSTLNVNTSASETYIGEIRPISIVPSELSSLVKVYLNNTPLIAGVYQLGEAGTYTIRYVFEGNDYYYPSSTQYQIVYTQEQEQQRISPNLSFATTTVSITKSQEDYTYTIQQVTNPYSVSPIVYYVNGQQVSGTYTITEAGTYTVSAVFAGNEDYLSQTVTYTVVVSEIEIVKVSPNLSFANSTVSITKSQSDYVYTIQQVTNPYNVSPILYYMNGQQVSSTYTITDEGTYTVSAVFAGNDSYLAQTVTYSVVVTEETIIDYSEQYLTFEAIEDTTFNIESVGISSSSTLVDKTLFYNTYIYYSLDNGNTWTITYTERQFNISILAGEKVLLKATLRANYEAPWYVGKFTSTGRFKVYGNILSLFLKNPDDAVNYPNKNLNYQISLSRMFYNNTKLVDASNLVLPDFRDIQQNINVNKYWLPERDRAFYEMFSGCTSLISAPKVITVLGGNFIQYTCAGMFNGCSSLVNAPELPSTELCPYCYYQMFNGCSSLNYIKCLATNMSATYCTNNWLNGVSQTGIFVKATNATWPTGDSGIPSGWTIIYE